MSPTSLLIFTQLFSFLPAAKPAPPFPSTTNTLPSRDELSLLHEKAEELVKLYLDFISYEQKVNLNIIGVPRSIEFTLFMYIWSYLVSHFTYCNSCNNSRGIVFLKSIMEYLRRLKLYRSYNSNLSLILIRALTSISQLKIVPNQMGNI